MRTLTGSLMRPEQKVVECCYPASLEVARFCKPSPAKSEAVRIQGPSILFDSEKPWCCFDRAKDPESTEDRVGNAVG